MSNENTTSPSPASDTTFARLNKKFCGGIEPASERMKASKALLAEYKALSDADKADFKAMLDAEK